MSDGEAIGTKLLPAGQVIRQPDVLKDEIARNGTIPQLEEGLPIPPDTPCITAAARCKAYELRSLAESEAATERAFYPAAKDLIEKCRLVAKHDAWVCQSDDV